MENLGDNKSRGLRGWIIALILVGALGLTAVLSIWVAKLYFFPKPFQAVQLNDSEQQVLNHKIQSITAEKGPTKNRTTEKMERETAKPMPPEEPLAPEPYDESDARRKISLNERELNALLAKNTDLADKVAIDLSKDMASIKILIPLDPELPVLGGKTLKVTAGLELRHDQQKPTAILKGVSIWGIPIPNAWLGGYKDTDLIKAFGADNGFWQSFSAGIEDLHVEDGHLVIQLAQ